MLREGDHGDATEREVTGLSISTGRTEAEGNAALDAREAAEAGVVLVQI